MGTGMGWLMVPMGLFIAIMIVGEIIETLHKWIRGRR